MKNTANSEHTFFDTFNQYKSLIRELTRKSIKLKYRDSVLGIFWSFIQPLLNMIVLSVVFGSLLGGRQNFTCFPVYLFTGRLLFEFFTTSTKTALLSFRANATIIKKVYVPKYIYPISSILSTFVNLAISLLCLICVWIFFKITGISGGHDLILSPYMLLFFVPLVLLLVFATGIGLILSIFNVYFKDIKYMWDVFCTLL
ncbi:MAG: ABC transporter permease, partial [Clostridiales bacterium]|nr:ABC transporter permease [Clostridiales bacterium]